MSISGAESEVLFFRAAFADADAPDICTNQSSAPSDATRTSRRAAGQCARTVKHRALLVVYCSRGTVICSGGTVIRTENGGATLSEEDLQHKEMVKQQY